MSSIKKKFGMLFKKKEEDEIKVPQEWLTPDIKDTEVEEAQQVPLKLVEPTPTFGESLKKGRRLKIPGMIKIRQIFGFLMLVADVVVIIGVVTLFPPALIFFVPLLLLIIDYLMLTRINKRQWYLLDNLEKEEQ